jgi:hypothetical protein
MFAGEKFRFQIWGGAGHGKNGFSHITGEEVAYKFIQIMCKRFVEKK